MKQIFIYILILLCILFLLPSIFTKKKDAANENEEINNQTEEPIVEYDYSKYSTIKLYHNKTGEIENLPIDVYLYGVVSGEMPVSYEMEALKAQAIVARTYTLYQIINSNGKHGEADICDNSNCCQAWITKEYRLERWEENLREQNWEKITKAVDSTQGKIVTYGGLPIDAFFHSNSGGKTETAINVWGGGNFPYLQCVETAGESDYEDYNSEVEISKEELVNKLKEKHPEIEIDFSTEKPIEILEYTESGRVRTIMFGNTEISGTETRSTFGLRSTNFSFEINNTNVKFFVVGYGHGVGMSQTGANTMAKTGSTYEDIIKHFYTGVEVTYVNELK